VAMRARNPCLLIRRLLRGRYEGFIGSFLQSEPGKLVWRGAGVKLSPRAASYGLRTTRFSRRFSLRDRENLSHVSLVARSP
jgi:hypothetical protein